MQYLDLEEVLRLHYQVIEDFGGSHGIREEGRLKSVCAAPAQSVFGQEQYATIFEKAAVYLRNIIADHPFMDGNKRTAVVVCGVFLMRIGHHLTVRPQALEDFAVQIATDHLDVPEIALWLQQYSKEAK